MGRVNFIQHQGTEILHIDFSGVRPELFVEVIREAGEIIRQRPPGSVLTLTDVRDAHFNKEVADALKVYVEANKPFVKAGAVVGLNELRRIIFNALNRITGRELVGMDDLELAKDWLAAKS